MRQVEHLWPLAVGWRLVAAPRWVRAPELLDQPGQPPELLRGNLRDLARVNRWLGGVRLTKRAIESLANHHDPAEPLAVLDVAGGGLDIPYALLEWGAARGPALRVVASDLSAEILALDHGDIPRVGADGRALPFADDSFDIATCSLALHHLEPAEARRMLREMARVSRLGIVVNDLVRSWAGLFGAFGLCCLTGNPLTRHDAPLSVHRAYTRHQLRALLRAAGLEPVAEHRCLGYRVALAARSRA
ncbi:MAG TPA: methyltransferase domain-containing protein [Thermomicrobiaceae bacterium]|nr:methyltransferase domain-containing protein [Thermomicrobiaceae bacterium]